MEEVNERLKKSHAGGLTYSELLSKYALSKVYPPSNIAYNRQS
jgi:hypothetical protein